MEASGPQWSPKRGRTCSDGEGRVDIPNKPGFRTPPPQNKTGQTQGFVQLCCTFPSALAHDGRRMPVAVPPCGDTWVCQVVIAIKGTAQATALHSQKEIKADHEPESPVLGAFPQCLWRTVALANLQHVHRECPLRLGQPCHERRRNATHWKANQASASLYRTPPAKHHSEDPLAAPPPPPRVGYGCCNRPQPSQGTITAGAATSRSQRHAPRRSPGGRPVAVQPRSNTSGPTSPPYHHHIHRPPQD